MTPSSEMTDRQLVESYAASGDTESLSVFITRHQHSLLRFAGRFLGNRHAAQDVLQQTFVQVARHPNRILKAGSCHNGLLRVARSIGTSHKHRNSRPRRRAESLTGRGAGRAATQVLDGDDRTRLVQNAIDRLDPRQREVVLLKIQEEKSYGDIAEITGLSATDVGHLLHAAMRELAKRLNKPREDV